MNALDLISAKLAEKKIKNRRFSLRAFSRQLGISPATLSQVISGKRALSLETARKLAAQLKLTDEERAHLFAQLLEGRRPAAMDARIKAQAGRDLGLRNLSSEEFSTISSWFYFAVLALSKTADSKVSAAWVSSRLGISFQEAQLAVRLLVEMSALKINDDKLEPTGRGLVTSTDIPSAAIRNNHRQLLRRAEDRLETVPVELRDFSSVTFAFDPKKMVQAKKLIKDFRRRFWRLMERGKPSEVYALTMQFFPLTNEAGGDGE